MITLASEFLTSYYAVCYYGKSSSGRLLKPEEYRKRWDRNEVIKTHKFISNRVRKCFGDIPLFWFSNRHDDYEDIEGNCKKGSFHSDLYIGEIPNEAITTHSDALLELLGKSDQSGIPINIKEVGMRALKLLLLELCIREAKWGRTTPKLTKTSESSSRRVFANL